MMFDFLNTVTGKLYIFKDFLWALFKNCEKIIGSNILGCVHLRKRIFLSGKAFNPSVYQCQIEITARLFFLRIFS